MVTRPRRAIPLLGRRPLAVQQSANRGRKHGTLATSILLTTATVLGALITLRAEFLSAEAHDMWARAARAEARRDGFVVNETEYVLGQIGYQKFWETKAALLRHQFMEYARLLSRPRRADLLTAARVQSLSLEHARGGLAISGQDDAYLAGSDYDYGDHLASDLDDFILPSPSRNQLQGNVLADRAVRTMLLTIAAATGFMLAAFATVFKRMNRVLTWSSAGALAITSGVLAVFVLWSV